MSLYVVDKLVGMRELAWHKGACLGRDTKSLKHLGLLLQWPEKTEKLENENVSQKRAENYVCPASGS